MATADWNIPTGKEITGSTFIKETDNHLSDTIADLVKWVNSTTPYTTTGLSQSMVDVTSAQTIAGIKTFSDIPVFSTGLTTTGIALGSTAITATGDELNYTGGVTSNIQTQLDLKSPIESPSFTGTADAEAITVDGGTTGTNSMKLDANQITFYNGNSDTTSINYYDTSDTLGISAESVLLTGQIKGITPVSSNDLTRKDYVDNAVTLAGTSGAYTPTVSSTTNVSSSTARTTRWMRINDYVHVTGVIAITPTSTGSTVFHISLPVASTLLSSLDLSGLGGFQGSLVGNGVATIRGETTTAKFTFISTSTSVHNVNFTFMYTVR